MRSIARVPIAAVTAFFALLLTLYLAAAGIAGQAPLYPTPDPEVTGLVEGLLGPYPDEPSEVRIQADLAILAEAAGIPLISPPRAPDVWAAGDFNEWRPGVHRLTPDGSGKSSLTLKLPRGRYAYKLVVSGKWIPDPSNPRKVPDGFGGTNSLVIAGPDEPRPRLYPVLVREKSGGNGVFTFGSSHPIDAAAAVCGGVPVDSTRIAISPGGLGITIDMVGAIPPRKRFTLSARTPGGTLSLPFEAWSHDLFPAALIPGHPSDPRRGPTGIIYFAFTDRFRNGSRENDDPIAVSGLDSRADFLGGDFAGLEMSAAEGWFETLCCDYLWISPVNENAGGAWRDSLPPHRLFSAYHGYWPTQLFSTQPRFGGLADLRRLSRTLNSTGGGLMLDLVLNHLHQDSPYFETGSMKPTEAVLQDGRRNLRLFDTHPLTTWFDSFIPSLDYEADPATAGIMTDNARWWASVAMASGLRLDAVKHLPVSLFRELRSKIPESTSVFMVGETIDSRDTISKYIGPGLMNAQFDFPLYFAVRDTIARQACGLDQLEGELCMSEAAFGSLAGVSTLLGNHDFPRFCAYADGDVSPGADDKEPGWSGRLEVDSPAAYERLAVAFAFLLTNRGYPLIYYGDEIGMTGAGDPDNRRPFEGPGGVGFDGVLDDDRAALLNQVRALAAYRAGHRHMVLGTRIPLAAGPDGLAFLRVWTDGSTLVAIGRPGREVSLDFQMPESIPFTPFPIRGSGLGKGRPELKGGPEDPVSATVGSGTIALNDPLPGLRGGDLDNRPAMVGGVRVTIGPQGYALFLLKQ